MTHIRLNSTRLISLQLSGFSEHFVAMTVAVSAPICISGVFHLLNCTALPLISLLLLPPPKWQAINIKQYQLVACHRAQNALN